MTLTTLNLERCSEALSRTWMAAVGSQFVSLNGTGSLSSPRAASFAATAASPPLNASTSAAHSTSSTVAFDSCNCANSLAAAPMDPTVVPAPRRIELGAAAAAGATSVEDAVRRSRTQAANVMLAVAGADNVTTWAEEQLLLHFPVGSGSDGGGVKK